MFIYFLSLALNILISGSLPQFTTMLDKSFHSFITLTSNEERVLVTIYSSKLSLQFIRMVGPSFLTLTMFKIVTKVVVCLDVLEFMLSIFLLNLSLPN